jgi:phosphoribosylamine--glycine ligase
VRGELQDRLRRDGFKVIGGSAYGDRLENDRAYAQRVLSDLGLRTAAVHEFTSVADASAFVSANPGRYVLKFNGGAFRSSSNYVGRMPDGRDALAVLKAQTAGMAPGEPLSFVLMQHVEGVEMGVGAYFDGERFVGRACLDWEHKRFFPGDLGELTGEMGTVATFERSDSFFERTLQRMAPLLRDGKYCGYINLNTIVNEDGIWPLEFTCRFGYPGYAVLGPLQTTPWGDLFAAMAHRRGTVRMDDGFSVAIVVTTPPFPYDRSSVEEEVGVPVIVTEPLTAAEQEGLYLGEVGMVDGQLVTSGKYGWTLVAAGIGADIAAARQAAYGLAGKFVIPNARYRADIGDKLMAGDFHRVAAMGYLG